MINYIGDISKADAQVLEMFGAISKEILEFGCGASTQVMAYYTGGHITSIDTEQVWLDKTKVHLDRLLVEPDKYTLMKYTDFNPTQKEKYDFVFDDGADSMRRDFGINIWPFIKIGGYLALHDQRRKPDFDNALVIIDRYWMEVDIIYMNYMHSNITFIKKKKEERWSNWQIDENIDMSKW